MDGDLEAVSNLLDAGLPVDLPDPTGQSALEWAVPSEQTAAADLLISRGANINHQVDDGRSLLKGVVQAKNTRMVEFLLQRGADPNVADNRGFTPLHVAAELDLFEITKLLLDHGARTDIEAGGHTPRSLAVLRGRRTIVGLMDKRMGEGQA
jgi:ankyrin repeat protein